MSKVTYQFPKIGSDRKPPSPASEEPQRRVRRREGQLITGYVGYTHDLHHRLGERVRAAGYTWTTLAGELGMSRQAIIKAMQGRIVYCERLAQACASLGIDIDAVLDGELDVADNSDLT